MLYTSGQPRSFATTAPTRLTSGGSVITITASGLGLARSAAMNVSSRYDT